MKSTDTLAEQAMIFQNVRRAENEAFREKMHSLEKYKGSEYYTEERKRITGEHDELLNTLKTTYGKQMHETIASMRNAVKERSMKPVSTDQYNTLQTLKMKQRLTDDDVARAANLCKDNPTALSVLSEIAQAAGLRHINPTEYGAELSNSEANEYIDGLERGISDLLEYDTSYIARTLNARKARYGELPLSEDKLPFRELTRTSADFYSEFSSIPADMVDSFCKAVNGDE